MERSTQSIAVPKGVTVKLVGSTVTAKGAQGEVTREILDPSLSLRLDADQLHVEADGTSKREWRKVRTWRAHLLNMMRGCAEAHTYRLKICAGHFPMNVTVQGQDFTIKNFLGEKVPRKLKLRPGVKVAVEADQVVITSPSKELAGQTAADIEQLCRVTGRDRRVFQDGVWIVHKDGKDVR